MQASIAQPQAQAPAAAAAPAPAATAAVVVLSPADKLKAYIQDPAHEAGASQALIAAIVAAAAEGGLMRVPGLGRVAAVSLTSALGSFVATIVGQMVLKRSVKVFDGFGKLCSPAGTLGLYELVVPAASALIVAAVVSGVIDSHQRAQLAKGELGLHSVSRALIVGAAVGASQILARKYLSQLIKASICGRN